MLSPRWVWSSAWGERRSCLPANQRQAGLYSADWRAEEANWGGSQGIQSFKIIEFAVFFLFNFYVFEYLNEWIFSSPFVGKECSCSRCAISPPWLWPSEGAVWGGAGGQGWAAAWNVQGQQWGCSVEEQVWNWCYPAHWGAWGSQVSLIFDTLSKVDIYTFDGMYTN